MKIAVVGAKGYSTRARPVVCSGKAPASGLVRSPRKARDLFRERSKRSSATCLRFRAFPDRILARMRSGFTSPRPSRRTRKRPTHGKRTPVARGRNERLLKSSVSMSPLYVQQSIIMAYPDCATAGSRRYPLDDPRRAWLCARSIKMESLLRGSLHGGRRGASPRDDSSAGDFSRQGRPTAPVRNGNGGDGNHFISLIHVEDGGRFVLAAPCVFHIHVVDEPMRKANAWTVWLKPTTPRNPRGISPDAALLAY